MDIYLSKEGAPSGPFTLEEITSMLARGQSGKSDLAWVEGSEGWQPLESIIQAICTPPPFPELGFENRTRNAPCLLEPLRSTGALAGFWCIPSGANFTKLGMPLKHKVDAETILLNRCSARTYPALTVLAQAKFLGKHFPWLSLHMHEEMVGGGKTAFTAAGPARSFAYTRLIKLLQREGWSYVLQDGETAYLGAGSLLPQYCDTLRLELSGASTCSPAHVRLTGINSVIAVAADGTESAPLPISVALGKFAQ